MAAGCGCPDSTLKLFRAEPRCACGVSAGDSDHGAGGDAPLAATEGLQELGPDRVQTGLDRAAKPAALAAQPQPLETQRVRARHRGRVGPHEMGVVNGAGEGAGIDTIGLGARDVPRAAQLRDGRRVNLAHLNALPGELLRECLPARSCRLDDHQDATLQPGKLPEEPVDAIARMSEPEPPIGPIRCPQHRFVRRAAPQIDADCPRGLARVDSRSHVRHPLHPASSDSGLSPHTTGPMSYSKRRLTYGGCPDRRGTLRAASGI